MVVGLFAQVLAMKQAGLSLEEIKARLLTGSGELRRRRLRRPKRKQKAPR
jgi:hypothetical protein